MVVRTQKFKLLKRTRHVLSEAQRVQSFRHLLSHQNNQTPLPSNRTLTPSTPSNDPQLLHKLGQLMDSSQTSCRNDFECSCPELDDLCSIARKHGAFGARLTGAGWGGAIVALTTKKDAQRVVDGLIAEYYGVKFPEMGKEELGRTVFATQPGSGALVYVVGEGGIT